MATVGDYIGLSLVLALAFGVIMALRHKADAKQVLKDKKKDLQTHGIDISSEGVAIRTNHHAMSREEYIVSHALLNGRMQRRRSSMKVGRIWPSI